MNLCFNKMLLIQWFGDAEKLTKALFSFASKLAPVIIFVDEVSNFFGRKKKMFYDKAAGL